MVEQRRAAGFPLIVTQYTCFHITQPIDHWFHFFTSPTLIEARSRPVKMQLTGRAVPGFAKALAVNTGSQESLFLFSRRVHVTWLGKMFLIVFTGVPSTKCLDGISPGRHFTQPNLSTPGYRKPPLHAPFPTILPLLSFPSHTTSFVSATEHSLNRGLQPAPMNGTIGKAV